MADVCISRRSRLGPDARSIMTRGTLAGGFAPTRNSCFEDPRVKAKAKVMAGTARHLPIVKWTIDNVMATEPHFPLWIGDSTNELPTEIAASPVGANGVMRCATKI